jgi:type II secretory pathway pseudopilin PulG
MFRTLTSKQMADGGGQMAPPPARGPGKSLPSAIRHLPSNQARGRTAEGGGQKPTIPRSALRALRSQEGFTLAALLVILTIIALVIAYTVPDQWSLIMGRERDKQTIYLMKQFARSIKSWSMKNGGMPTSLDQILDARRPRFIRGVDKPICPITGKADDWILVPFNAITNPPANNGQLQAQPSKLNKEASPREYTGPFIGVRPAAEGKSYIEFNGASDYSEWVYTVMDLEVEIAARNASAMAK